VYLKPGGGLSKIEVMVVLFSRMAEHIWRLRARRAESRAARQLLANVGFGSN
jgi:hypothetical protein